VRLIDLEQRRQVAQLVDRGGLGAEPIHRRSRSFVSCSPSGRYVCSGDEDRGLRVWRLAGGEPVLHLSDAHRKGVNAGCILAGDQHLVSGEATGEIRVWRIDSGTLLARFLCRAPVVSLCEAGTERIIVIEGSLPRPRLRVFRLVLPGAD
jgi:WD40 repeat protein